MPETPHTPASLINTARTVQEKLAQGVKRLGAETPEGRELHMFADRIDTLAGLYQRLHGKQPEVALEHANAYLRDIGQKTFTEVADARTEMAKYLETTVETANGSRTLKGTLRVIEKEAETHVPRSAVKNVESLLGKLSRKQDRFLKKRSPHTRIAFALVEFSLGSILMTSGLDSVLTAARGSTQTMETQPDGSLRIRETELSATGRAMKALVGTGVGLAGLTASILGIMELGKPRIPR